MGSLKREVNQSQQGGDFHEAADDVLLSKQKQYFDYHKDNDSSKQDKEVCVKAKHYGNNKHHADETQSERRQNESIADSRQQDAAVDQAARQDQSSENGSGKQEAALGNSSLQTQRAADDVDKHSNTERKESSDSDDSKKFHLYLNKGSESKAQTAKDSIIGTIKNVFGKGEKSENDEDKQEANESQDFQAQAGEPMLEDSLTDDAEQEHHHKTLGEKVKKLAHNFKHFQVMLPEEKKEEEAKKKELQKEAEEQWEEARATYLKKIEEEEQKAREAQAAIANGQTNEAAMSHEQGSDGNEQENTQKVRADNSAAHNQNSDSKQEIEQNTRGQEQ